MNKVILLKGLPASGKSTWAREQVRKNPKIKRVCKDDLRAMMDDSIYSKDREKEILRAKLSLGLERKNSVLSGEPAAREAQRQKLHDYEVMEGFVSWIFEENDNLGIEKLIEKGRERVSRMRGELEKYNLLFADEQIEDLSGRPADPITAEKTEGVF